MPLAAVFPAFDLRRHLFSHSARPKNIVFKPLVDAWLAELDCAILETGDEALKAFRKNYDEHQKQGYRGRSTRPRTRPNRYMR